MRVSLNVKYHLLGSYHEKVNPHEQSIRRNFKTPNTDNINIFTFSFHY